MRAVFLAAAAAAVLIFPAGMARADEGGADNEYEERARKGLETVMRALENFLESIPQYEMPEVLDNGDIIIRRADPKTPDRAPNPKAEPESESTRI